MAYTTVGSYDIPDGDKGTLATIAMMKRLIVAASMHPDVRDMAIKIMRPDRVSPGMAIQTLRRWLQVAVQFVRDPVTAEALTDPVAMIQRIEDGGRAPGDCDDVAMLAAAMALSVGFRARLVAVGFKHTAPLTGALDGKDPFLHIWTEVAPPTGTLVWTEMDTTRPMQRIPVDAFSRVLIVPIPHEG